MDARCKIAGSTPNDFISAAHFSQMRVEAFWFTGLEGTFAFPDAMTAIPVFSDR